MENDRPPAFFPEFTTTPREQVHPGDGIHALVHASIQARRASKCIPVTDSMLSLALRACIESIMRFRRTPGCEVIAPGREAGLRRSYELQARTNHLTPTRESTTNRSAIIEADPPR